MVVDVDYVVAVVIVDPRNLPLKLGQNLVSNSKNIVVVVRYSCVVVQIERLTHFWIKE